jgi:hypothetical protein
VAAADLGRTRRRRANGKLAVLNDINGHQVTYNGHPLYTFADDHAGQGIQNFSVATPSLTPLTTSSAGTGPPPPPAAASATETVS